MHVDLLSANAYRVPIGACNPMVPAQQAHFGWIATTLAISSYALTLFSWSHRYDRLRVVAACVAPVLVWLVPIVLTVQLLLDTSPDDPALQADYECYYNSGSILNLGLMLTISHGSLGGDVPPCTCHRGVKC